LEFFAAWIFWESNFFALSNSRFRVALRPRPARLMRQLSMRMPDAGPFGETRFEARDLAIAAASRVNNPSGG
jgi:hypothetical protein